MRIETQRERERERENEITKILIFAKLHYRLLFFRLYFIEPQVLYCLFEMLGAHLGSKGECLTEGALPQGSWVSHLAQVHRRVLGSPLTTLVGVEVF